MISITVARKPLPASTVAESVLQTGTGSINIDACRVSPPEGDDFSTPKVQVGAKEVMGSIKKSRPQVLDGHTIGRWPANLILQHLPGCVCTGTHTVKGSHDTTGVWGRAGAFDQNGWQRDKTDIRRGHTNRGGTETVEAWDCEPGCPVSALDTQSGTTKSQPDKRNIKGTGGIWSGSSNFPCGPSYTDEGGASRFFKQVSTDKQK